MRISYKIYVVTDVHGHKDAAVVNEDNDNVMICGMLNPSGDKVYFESEAYHLGTWCDGHGLELRMIKRMEDV